MVFCRSANVARLPGVCEAASGFVYSCCLLPAALFLGLAAAALGAEMPEAVPVDGKPFRAELVGADARWQLTFKAGEGPRVVPGAELVRWGTPAEAHRGPVLVLADGGRLPAAVLGAEKGTLLADSFRLVPDDAAAQGLKLPLESLAGVVFRLPADHHQRDLLLDRVASASGESDRLILTGGDEIAATVRAIDEGTIHLVTDVGPVDVELYRARALVFNPALRRRPQQDPKGLHAWAGFRDGTQLLVAGMTLDEKSLRVSLPGGLKLKGEPRDLVFLQPLGGRVTYLSDRKPDGYRFVPFFDLHWPYRADRNVTGARLRAGGRLYQKGLGVHSAGRLMVKLDGSYRRFEAATAIDDSTGRRGSVRFRVFVDGRQQAAAGPVRGGDKPVPISVDLAGAKQLDLVVDYAERGDELDHADWLDARLVK